ncbi:AMP-binding protein [Actinocorallia aurantiaca]|uniref:Acyl-CoA ligase FadD12 n=1 Tax=Actinocorallia aurantiaca TaxID=46204 RepID=A0ABN3U1J4_9ACTN
MTDLREAVKLATGTVRVLRDIKILTPITPVRLARIPLQVVRFGFTPAVAGAMSALRGPDRVAVIDERGEITYGELEARAASQATALREILGPGEKIGILCRNHRGFVEAVSAGSRLGNDVVFLNTDFSAPQLSRVLKDEDIAVLVHDEEFSPVVDACEFTGTRFLAWYDAEEPPLPTLDDLARTKAEPLVAGRTSRIVILTSGTTGPPKGTAHEFGPAALVSQGFGHLLRLPLRAGEPLVVGPPLFHGLGLTYLLTGLALGAPLVLLRRFDAGAVLEAVARHRAGAVIAVPVMLQRMLDVRDAPRLPSLRVVLSGGAALHPNLVRRFRRRFGEVLYNAYGASETGWAAIATPDDLRAAPGTIGRPTLGVKARILDPDGRPVERGEIGTLHLDSGLEFRGYTGGGTKDFVDGLISTGDLGHADEEGRLFIDGRADDMIVSGGENVFPGEVEDLLEQHPEISEVAVTGVEDEEFGQRLAAWVVRTPGSEVTEAALKAHVREQLARYKVPRDITFVEELPRTTTGKVKRRDLKGA